MGFLKHYIAPLILIIGAPICVQLLANYPRDEGLDGFKTQMLFGNGFSWAIVTIWLMWCAFFLIVPFDRYKGQATNSGDSPEYSDNCAAVYFTSFASYLGMHSLWPNLSNNIYDNFPYIMGVANIYGFAFSLYLWCKENPETKEKQKETPDTPGLYKFYAGQELHPRISDFDVKQWALTRVACMGWLLLAFTFTMASYFKSGFSAGILVNLLLQLVYLHNFFDYEPAFLTAFSIRDERAGFYPVWGCMNLVPALYTYSTYYFVNHPPDFTYLESVILLLVGIAIITIKYMIDNEKDKFKLANGNLNVWGKKATFIEAEYQTTDGLKKARLLTSGFWGISRHLNYVFELLSALTWSMVGLRSNSIQPFIYAIFLFFFLLHRTYKNEKKCSEKYGTHWQHYCKIVNYKFIPYVY